MPSVRGAEPPSRPPPRSPLTASVPTARRSSAATRPPPAAGRSPPGRRATGSTPPRQDGRVEPTPAARQHELAHRRGLTAQGPRHRPQRLVRSRRPQISVVSSSETDEPPPTPDRRTGTEFAAQNAVAWAPVATPGRLRVDNSGRPRREQISGNARRPLAIGERHGPKTYPRRRVPGPRLRGSENACWRIGQTHPSVRR